MLQFSDSDTRFRSRICNLPEIRETDKLTRAALFDRPYRTVRRVLWIG